MVIVSIKIINKVSENQLNLEIYRLKNGFGQKERSKSNNSNKQTYCEIRKHWNFKDVMEQKGFIVINSNYITWYYIAQIMSEEKQLCKKSQLKDFVLSPRFDKQISRRRSKQNVCRFNWNRVSNISVLSG